MGKKDSPPEIIESFLKKTDFLKLNRYLYEIEDNTKTILFQKKSFKPVIIISGPTCGGKDSIINKLPEEFLRIRTCTTRKTRPEEVGSDPYFRLSEKEFKQGLRRGDFLEFNFFDGNYYGTRIKEIKDAVGLGKIPILRIDPTGARNVLLISQKGKKEIDDLFFVYFYAVPPNVDVIRERIFKRDVEIYSDPKERKMAEKKTERRLKGTVKRDLELMVYAHFILINYQGELDKVAEEFRRKIREFSG